MAVYNLTILLILLVSNAVVFHVKSEAVQPLMSSLGYLEAYGYMDKPDPNAFQLITDIKIQEAIIRLQRFFNLPETGQIDQRTAELMQKPRCGLPDLPRDGSWSGYGPSRGLGRRGKRYSAVDGIRWNKRDLTYSFDNFTPDISRAQTRVSIDRAMKVWSDVTPLTFRETRGGNPDIHIQFTRRSHSSDEFAFDGRGGTLAHAFFPGEDIGGDVHFDDDEVFTYNSFGGTNLFTVAAHELGHSLGLGHSDVPGSLMAPYYQGYDPNFDLPYDDIRGIQSLYGRNYQPPSRPDRPPQPPRPTSPPERPETAKPTPSPTCLEKFSAMSNIRGEVFLFSEDQMWRLASDGRPLAGYPMPASRFWKSAPSNPDAVFEKLDGTIVFVKGPNYWGFDGLNLIRDFPKPLLDFTEDKVAEVDAAVSMRREGKTYFFKGALCWRFDGTSERMEEGYPKFIKDEWIGGPEKVDGAFRLNGDVYLVSNNRYWRFSDGSMTATTATQTETTWFTVDILGCSPDSVVPDDDLGSDEAGTDGQGAASRTVSGLGICVLLTLVPLLFSR